MSYKIKELPEEERPRERLVRVGTSNLSDSEVLSILLKTGMKNKNVEELSIELLKRYPLSELKDTSISELMKIDGIGEVKAIELLAAIELGKRIFLRDAKRLEKLDSAEKIWESSKYLFHGVKQEMFYCYYFDNKQNLIEKKLIFMGTINSATTHTREIFREAYLLSACSIVCLHNHPSGDVTPSQADIFFTDRLMQTGSIQGIPVVDHIIVSDNKYYSFYEHKDILN